MSNVSIQVTESSGMLMRMTQNLAFSFAILVSDSGFEMRMKMHGYYQYEHDQYDA